MDVKSPLGDVSTRGVDSLGQTVATDSASTLSLLLVTTVSSSSGWLKGGGLQDSVSYNGTVYNMSSDEFDADTNVTGPIFTTPTYMLVWVTIANVLVFVTGVIGNTLVILVVTCVHDMKTATNLCLMNLSIADLLVLLICQPSALLEFYAEEKWMLGSFMCKLTVFLENAVTLASILIILSVSFERYYAVCYPLRMYSTESRFKAMVLMAVMWLVALALTAPFLAIAYTRREYHYVEKEEVDVCTSRLEHVWQYGYIIARFIVVFVIPMCLLVFLYSRIIVKVAVDTMDCRQMTDRARLRAQRSRQQLVIMLIGIIVLFFACLLPFRIMALYSVHQPPDLGPETHLNIMHFCRLLLYVNSAGNPIIYNLASTKFRRAFARVLYRLGCRLRILTRGITSEENGTLRRTTVTHYTSVNRDEGPTDTV